MSRTTRHIALVMAVMLVLSGCGRVKPQGAANKQEADSTALALMQMNFLMALETDQMLVDSVRESGLPYVLDQHNFWYYRLESSEGEEVQRGNCVEYTATVRDLSSGALIEDITEEVEVGKGQTLRAIDKCLPLMKTGEMFCILAPYYTAYGRDGNDHVPPLTNVKITLFVHNITKI